MSREFFFLTLLNSVNLFLNFLSDYRQHHSRRGKNLRASELNEVDVGIYRLL